MSKILLCVSLTFSLYAKEYLYTHIPSELPSKKAITSFGKQLISLIENSEDEILFAIYGLRGQNDILKALIKSQNRGIKIKGGGVVDSDSHDRNYYSDTHKLYEHFKIVNDHKSYIMHNKFFVFYRKTVWY